ncbi:HK97-gp10 family putative phage morphogenesis protein [Massilia sp. 9096]|uniref:HK97-gp10 family putative phage morphogenesis protein n=1 Tax=Massilia sp. 9096 TaxID=1500894 RepID=UPI00055B2B4C|nr:HK97-gp10 family putative phage morphogenesis protein [Massilia sp. 9096]
MPDQTVTGLDEFIGFLDGSPAQMEQSMHVGLFAGAQLIEATARANCPVHLGELRNTIHTSVTEKGSEVVATVSAGGTAPDGTPVWYAHIIEYTGAAPHDITGKNGGDVAFGGHAYPVVHHPGMKAHPFLRPAVDANEVAAIGLIDQQIEAALQNTR